MGLRSRNKVSVEFNMSSMTDIVFLLLIFFMITSTLIAPNALKLLLPKSNNQTMSDKPVLAVSIKHAGTNEFIYAIGQDYITFQSLEQELIRRLSNETEPTLSLHVDMSVPMEQVVKVLNIAKKNRYKLILATSSK